MPINLIYNLIYAPSSTRFKQKFIFCALFTATSGIPPSANIIVAHPDFRMIVLANRPGFPFLGNDFFGAMGKIELNVILTENTFEMGFLGEKSIMCSSLIIYRLGYSIQFSVT